MVRRLRRRLEDERGETLVESLVSVLIGALSMVLLAGAIANAHLLLSQSGDAMKAYYVADQALVSKQTADEHYRVQDGTTVTIADTAGAFSERVNVQGFKNETLPTTVVSYRAR